jgi:hypothetical protein
VLERRGPRGRRRIKAWKLFPASGAPRQRAKSCLSGPRRPQGGGRPGIDQPPGGWSPPPPVVVGFGVVVGAAGLAVVVVVVVVVVVGAVVVVVGAGEAAACAGTITDLTTGFTHCSGKTRALAAPPPSAARKIFRRSVVIVSPQPAPRLSLQNRKAIGSAPPSGRSAAYEPGRLILPTSPTAAGISVRVSRRPTKGCERLCGVVRLFRRMSPAGARLLVCSRATRRGGLRPTSRSCPKCSMPSQSQTRMHLFSGGNILPGRLFAALTEVKIRKMVAYNRENDLLQRATLPSLCNYSVPIHSQPKQFFIVFRFVN